MYNKTNVNSKRSMRAIKGHTGTATQSAPRSRHQPAPGIRPLSPSYPDWRGPQKTKQKSCEAVT